jgi:hypothetical protein
MYVNRLFPAFCLGLLCWSCTPSSWFTPAFRPQPGATYHYTVNEVTHAFSLENGVRVSREENVHLAFYYRLASPGTLAVGFDAFSFHERGEKREKNMDLSAGLREVRCALQADGRDITLSGVQASRDTYVARLLGKSWAHLPQGALKVGDSWHAMDSLNADPHIAIDTTFTLVKARDGVLFIQTDAVVRLEGENLEGTTHSGQLSLKGRQRGILHVDAATGMLLDGQTILKADGSLRTGAGNIPVHIDSTCSVNAA